MSGHSHAKNVARQKAVNSFKRGQVFSKMIRLLNVAVKEGGTSPESNSKLKAAIDRAKSFNMPNDNIEKAIKQAAGGMEAENLSEVILEAYGPGGIAVIIEAITDNKNRLLNEIKQALSQYNGKLAQEGSVRWMFDRKGVIGVLLEKQNEAWRKKESLELKAIEAGAQDFEWSDDLLEIFLPINDLQSTKGTLEKDGIVINSATVEWIAKNEVPVDAKENEASQKLFEVLDENSDVQDVYSNVRAS